MHSRHTPVTILERSRPDIVAAKGISEYRVAFCLFMGEEAHCYFLPWSFFVFDICMLFFERGLLSVMVIQTI